jgi:hypothetical protein
MSKIDHKSTRFMVRFMSMPYSPVLKSIIFKNTTGGEPCLSKSLEISALSSKYVGLLLVSGGLNESGYIDHLIFRPMSVPSVMSHRVPARASRTLKRKMPSLRSRFHQDIITVCG